MPEYQLSLDQFGEKPKPKMPPLPAGMATVVWYSYKGGVGRSMGLANICSLLVRQGYRVGVMDLDLEAPGLDTIPPFQKEADTSLGVLGFLSDI